MSKPNIGDGSGMMNSTLSMNQDLVTQLDALSSEAHTSSDCWKSGRPMIHEAVLWIAAAALIWIFTLLIVG